MGTQHMPRMRNLIELMVENCARQVLESWGTTNEALHRLKSSCDIIHYVLVSKDLGHVFSKQELGELARGKFTQLIQGKPFVRTVLAGLWFVKISMDPDWQQQIVQASRLKGDARNKRFQEISDEFFKLQDYDKMTVDELEWYVAKFNLEEYENYADYYAAISNLTVGFPFSAHAVKGEERRRHIAIQANLTSDDELKDQVRSLERKLAEKEQNVTMLQKEIQHLSGIVEELKETIKGQEQRIGKLSKKSAKHFVTIPPENLVKKCLQFAGSCTSVAKLAEIILMDENYDTAAVAALSGSICKQIEAHLKQEPGRRAWNRKYLMTLKSQKNFAKDSLIFDKMVDDMLRLKIHE